MGEWKTQRSQQLTDLMDVVYFAALWSTMSVPPLQKSHNFARAGLFFPSSWVIFFRTGVVVRNSTFFSLWILCSHNKTAMTSFCSLSHVRSLLNFQLCPLFQEFALVFLFYLLSWSQQRLPVSEVLQKLGGTVGF